MNGTLALGLSHSFCLVSEGKPKGKKNERKQGPTSFLKIDNASPTYGTDSSGKNSLTLSTSAAVVGGSNMIGPFPFTMSKGIFIPVRGVRMSENKITYKNTNVEDISQKRLKKKW